MPKKSKNSRQLAFLILREIMRKDTFADRTLDQFLNASQLSSLERGLTTELVYGIVRRKRSLDFLINQLATKKASQQPTDLRIILYLGLYQLIYLNQIPESAAVNTTVELTKENKLSGLSGFVNGLLRQYLRLRANNPQQKWEEIFAENLPLSPVERLGIIYSFPDWIVEYWLEILGINETEKLCQWFNQSPTIDLRVNPLRTTLDQVKTAFLAQQISVECLLGFPQTLRLRGSIGSIQNLPGYQDGWWTIQDSSAQLVSYLLAPKPGEFVIDVCAAPGGKTTHIAELMGDEGVIFAYDKTANRLKKLSQNCQRLGLKSIQIFTEDSRQLKTLSSPCDRLLLDVPCSGLGTLHRRVDARWSQTDEQIRELAKIQAELLNHTANLVKPGGVLVYATCTIHPLENEGVILPFLQKNSQWKIEIPSSDFPINPCPEGWVKVWPHQANMDGFFMVKLRQDKNP